VSMTEQLMSAPSTPSVTSTLANWPSTSPTMMLWDAIPQFAPESRNERLNAARAGVMPPPPAPPMPEAVPAPPVPEPPVPEPPVPEPAPAPPLPSPPSTPGPHPSVTAPAIATTAIGYMHHAFRLFDIRILLDVKHRAPPVRSSGSRLVFYQLSH